MRIWRYRKVNILIRNEERRDYRRTEEVAREAFGIRISPGFGTLCCA